MYDYGTPELNQFHYGQPVAPQWDPKDIEFRIYLMAGTTDRLADPVDVQHLLRSLENSIVWFKNYNSGHLTFIWGNEVEQMTDVLGILGEDDI